MPDVQPTNNPVPSDNPADARDNFKRIDEVVNSTENLTSPTRTGVQLVTLHRYNELVQPNIDGARESAEEAAASAAAAEAAVSGLDYQGLWPDTGGSANKGETWQTQAGGTPTGRYFTALQNTTVDPVGDDVNWREVLSSTSLENYTTVFVDAEGLGGIVNDTSAFQDAIDKASALQYVKRGVKILLRAPKNYYQVEKLNFNELWNIHLECETKNGWNRSETGAIETRGGNIHWIGNSTDSLFDFGAFCFGVNFKNIVVNGRDNCKLAYDLAAVTPSVLRDYYFENCGALYCDFGTVNGDVSGTDLAPVTWINPIFTQNKSAALINNSGNATITLIGGFITGNGYNPSAGNSFIPDVDNQGFQILNRAGHLSTLNITLDASSGNYPASGENVRISGGSATLDGWDDTPEVISVYTGGNVEDIKFGKWRHFDGAMTKANTPVSISHGSNTVMTLDGGVFLFGDVNIRSGNQAAVVDNGVRFEDPSLSGFIGDAIDLGGLARTTASGFNEVVSSVGGDIIKETGTLPATKSLLCRNNGILTAKKARGDGNTIVTESMDSSGRLSTYTNAYRDASTSQEKSIKAGDCIKMSIAGNGDWTFSTATASGADETLSFTTKFGVRAGVGGNGRKKLVLDVNEMAFEAPNSGAVTRGSAYFRGSATPGGKAFDIVTTTGIVGIDAVLKPAAQIDS